MNSNSKRYLYRRQYIIAPANIKTEGDFKIEKITGIYTLYYHVDLKFTRVNSNNKSIILLGDIFDYKNMDFNNTQIVNHLINFSFEKCIEETFDYAGRFLFIYIENEDIKIFHDAATSRKVYYHMNENVWCASQPHLLAKYLDLSHTNDKDILEYYNSDLCKFREYAGIIDSTIYDGIKQLPPNKYIDLSLKKVIRYWPVRTSGKIINLIPSDEIVTICSQMLSGFLESANKRYKLMIPVTAGNESRLLLAASRNIKNDVFYYINKTNGMPDNHNDIKIPKRLLQKFNLKLNILDNFQEKIDEEFIKIYNENVEFATKLFLPLIYNYHNNFSNYLNCPGPFNEVAVNFFNLVSIPASGKSLAKLYNLENFRFAHRQYSSWLSEIKELFKNDKKHLFNLFYWEERMGNWGTQIQTCKDIAQEEFLPFNSRKYIITLMSADPKYLEFPKYIIIRRIIKKL